jgi:hypothetical protein
MPLLSLPYTTFDEVRARGLEVVVYCSACRRKAAIDLDDPRLAGKSFAAGVRFTCSAVVQRWTADLPVICGSAASLHVRPPPARRLKPSQAILHCAISCPRCRPSWTIDEARRDDPVWKPMFERPRRHGFRCPACHAGLHLRWHGWDGEPFTDGYRRSAGG